jgi:inner membrane protein
VSPAFWHWLALGGALLLLETLTPGFTFLWLALAASLTGALLWAAPALPWQAQLGSFALGAVASVGAWFWWRRRQPDQAADPVLNRRAQSYVGGQGVLAVAIGAGHGRVRIADTTWPAAGPPLAEDTPVRIVGASGPVLLVEPVTAADQGHHRLAPAAGARGSPPAPSPPI